MSVTREQFDEKITEAMKEAMESKLLYIDILAVLEAAKLSISIMLTRQAPK